MLYLAKYTAALHMYLFSPFCSTYKNDEATRNFCSYVAAIMHVNFLYVCIISKYLTILNNYYASIVYGVITDNSCLLHDDFKKQWYCACISTHASYHTMVQNSASDHLQVFYVLLSYYK